MKIWNKIFLTLPWIVLLLSVKELILQPSITQSREQIDIEIILNEGRPKEREPEEISFTIKPGLVQEMVMLSGIAEELQDPAFPTDGKPEKTIERVHRILVGRLLGIVYIGFLLIVCISAWISLYYKVWFAKFLNRTMYIFSIPVYGRFVGEMGEVSKLYPAFAGILVFLGLSLLILTFISLFTIKSITPEEDRFIALKNLREGEDSDISRMRRNDSSLTGFLLYYGRMGFHFAMIIVVGVLIGNVFYIPLFTLQKNYVDEFGILLIFALIGMVIFYIKNYHSLGKGSHLSGSANWGISFSFFQFRVMRNFLSFLFSSVGIILFITVIFVLLTLNTVILRDNFHLIEQSDQF